ncbi:gamma-mobile-trio protein GmtX [Vibrio mimicus]|uniref:gamma-mobile-trio protein GmtX n=1 Tax=Vibrio mimicus TaxID=674 RepID=UPI0009BCB508|nr:gamma-mobile-trio protein GmtX [Vibrio mimicus]
MTEISPDIILTQLKSQVSERVQLSLQSIYQICVEQQQRGLNDFSYATIARLGKGRGVPAAQSIRNKTGEVYRTLISSFANQSVNSKTSKNTSYSKGYAWIDEIKDPVIKLQVGILYSQKITAERAVNEIAPINQVIEIFDGNSSDFLAKRLTTLEREALDYLLSSEFRRKNELELGKHGSIVSRNNDEPFLPVATIDAIEKALRYL